LVDVYRPVRERSGVIGARVTLRELLISQGLLTPADRQEPRPYVPVDLGMPVLKLIGTEGRPSKNRDWTPPFVQPPFTEGQELR
jgi:hypothetical protein